MSVSAVVTVSYYLAGHSLFYYALLSSSNPHSASYANDDQTQYM